jgi:glutaredoxin
MLRSSLYGALTSKVGDRLLPVRLARQALRYANDVVGRPLATREELLERVELERTRRAAPAAPREPAPVVVFHRDKHRAEVAKIKIVLDDRNIPYQLRNLEGDEPAMEAVVREANGFRLPVVFIAGTPVGKAEELTNLDQRGELVKRVFG